MWKAQLVVGGVRVPVKMYAAIAEKRVAMHLLHRADGTPVKQRMVHPVTHEEVPAAEVRRGVEIDDDTFVLLDDAELARAEPEVSRDIDVTRFVPRAAVDNGYFERPYYLGPDGDDAAYAAVVQVLGQSRRLGVAGWTMRGKRHHGVLEAHAHGLALVTLRSAEAVVPADALDRPAGRPLAPGERRLAADLIAALDAPFDPAELRDEYRERIEELVAAKVRGRGHQVKEAPPPPPSPSMTAALRASLRRAQGGARRKHRKEKQSA
jgi:DNA end-binding protein Ku